MKSIVIEDRLNTDFQFQEAIKTLRTNIQFSGSNVRTILITSTAPMEGKSTISWELAVSAAKAGKKICLIDADIRRSVFHRTHGLKEETDGLSQILSGQLPLSDAMYKTSIPNLYMIFTGPYTPSPTELFEDENCAAMFRDLKEDGFDQIFVDTPPLGSVIDAAILAKYADGFVLVADVGETKKNALRRVKEQIDRTGVRLLGVALNKAPMGKGSYYYGSYYGKYDSYYGS